MNWREITYKQYEELKNLLNRKKELSDEEFIKNCMSIVDGVNYADSTNINFLIKRFQKLEFLKTLPSTTLDVTAIEVNGNKYNVIKKGSDITTAMFYDYTQIANMNDDVDDKFVKLCGCFIIPEGHTYNDGYDLERVYNEIRQMSCEDVLSASFFFLKLFRKYVSGFQSYLKEMRMKNFKAIMSYVRMVFYRIYLRFVKLPTILTKM